MEYPGFYYMTNSRFGSLAIIGYPGIMVTQVLTKDVVVWVTTVAQATAFSDIC